jgi:hypothetical protein
VNRIFSSFCLASICVSSAYGGAVDAAILAVMKLPEAKNYSWVSTIEDDGRFYVIEGQTERGGFTRVNMPMVSAIQRKIGRDYAEIQTAIFKGSSHCVIQTPTGWKTPAELAALPPVGPKTRRLPSMAMPSGTRNLSTPSARPVRYSNIQLNLAFPHDEIGLIIGSHVKIHPEVDGVSGTLSEAGAKLLLVHPGQNEIDPLQASGTFRLWIEDAELVKYEVCLTGTIAVGGGTTRREVSLRQIATTEVERVDATTFEVPEEAKRKLAN